MGEKWGPNPNQEANSPAGKGNVSFLPWSVSGYIDYTLGQAPCPAVIGQHKTNSMVLYSVSFCLIGLSSVLILIFVFSWEVLGLFVCLFLLCGKLVDDIAKMSLPLRNLSDYKNTSHCFLLSPESVNYQYHGEVHNTVLFTLTKLEGKSN